MSTGLSKLNGLTMTSTMYPHQPREILHRSWLYTKEHLNFYRIHVLFFTFTPLIAAAIFYASNGVTHVSFIDALFSCVSHMTVTGLTTVDLSSLTSWQQVILLSLMFMGSPVAVSWIIVYVRRYYFAKKFKHILESRTTPAVSSSQVPWAKVWARFWRRIKPDWPSKSSSTRLSGEDLDGANGKSGVAEIIRRIDEAPPPLEPSRIAESSHKDAENGDPFPEGRQDRSSISGEIAPADDAPEKGKSVKLSLNPDPHPACEHAEEMPHLHSSSLIGQNGAQRTSDLEQDPRFRRTQAIEFVAPDSHEMHSRDRSMSHGSAGLHLRINSYGSIRYASPTRRQAGGFMCEGDCASVAHDHLYSNHDWHRGSSGRTATIQSNRSSVHPPPLRTKEKRFGGFPLPHVILSRLLRRLFPRFQARLARTATIPHTTTIQSQRGGQTTVLGATPVSYLSFDAIVGRNSAFKALSRENLDELGGVEYRALNILLWIVGIYHICVPLVGYIIIAPYISQPHWRDIFHPPMQHRSVPPAWYSLFQVVSAYTNSGSSLVDQSMIPFQKAYLEVLTLPFLILAGNTAFPIFLRFVIWLLTKAARRRPRANETLHFLLDHPRRCFIYLFPSHQTWFLLTVLIILNFTDWFFFLVLDIGNPRISVPIGTKFAIGFLQAVAVRAAGFSTVLLFAVAPAVKVLFVVMMYISVYPIAMSVRSTNVYEERSLGVFDDGPDDDAEEAALKEQSRTRVWGKYLAAHARQQLSFDMWWLALALFLLCIVEQGNLENESNAMWFNIWAIVFELTSAYGTVGLSLGTPNVNYSLSGTFKPLSKLILCAVMLRGRHRGLPIAIDRAVLLPAEFKKEDGVGGGGLEEKALSAGEEARAENLNTDFASGVGTANGG